MKIITSITSSPKQSFTLKLDNNESARIRMYFYPTQKSWYFDLEYKGYINNGNKIVQTMNALRHLRDRIPFGLAIVSSSQAEPFALDDFSSGKVLMLLLNSEEVETIEEVVYGG